jgi:hypothetical protein
LKPGWANSSGDRKEGREGGGREGRNQQYIIWQKVKAILACIISLLKVYKMQELIILNYLFIYS